MENFGRLFLIGLVTAAPGLALAFLTFVAAVPAMTGAYFGDAGLGGVISATVVACFLPLCCVLALAGLGLGLIQHFADRAAVLEGLPPGPAFRRGWAVLRSHLSEALVLFIVWMVVSWFFQIVSVTVVALSIPAIPRARRRRRRRFWRAVADVHQRAHRRRGRVDLQHLQHVHVGAVDAGVPALHCRVVSNRA
ncbi:MAG: hypothetical protein M5R40_26675 [Anaerolineae bacterium]|nr:hypothetical protein [Anaerolineae bacterium]